MCSACESVLERIVDIKRIHILQALQQFRGFQQQRMNDQECVDKEIAIETYVFYTVLKGERERRESEREREREVICYHLRHLYR